MIFPEKNKVKSLNFQVSFSKSIYQSSIFHFYKFYILNYKFKVILNSPQLYCSMCVKLNISQVFSSWHRLRQTGWKDA